MPFEVEFTPGAYRDLRRLDRAVAARIEAAIERLRSSPRPPGCKKLTGLPLWRIRIGDWRVVYSIDDGRLVVLIVRVAHRSAAYD